MNVNHSERILLYVVFCTLRQYRDRRKPEAGDMPYSYFEWLQGFFIVYITMDSTVHSMPLNNLEHYILCTTTMTNIKTTCTHKGWLNVSTAFGHFSMPSAQRWADNRCCREIPNPHFRTPITVGAFWSTFDPTVWDGGYLWHKVLYTAHGFVYMAINDLEIPIFRLFQCFYICFSNVHLFFKIDMSAYGVPLIL